MSTENKKPSPWLTAWDEEMVQRLVPLAGRNPSPRLQMLFFANTFPLAYHYAIALRRQGKSPEEYIRLGSWKEEGNQPVNVIYYTNEQRAEPDQDLVPATIFKPKWAFVPLTLGTWHLWNDLAPTGEEGDDTPLRPRGLAGFLTSAHKAGFEHLCVYAELEDLGEYLKSIIGSTPFQHTNIFAAADSTNTSSLPVFERPERHASVLRLFIYGGSLSSYLRGKYTRYLPLELPDGLELLRSKMRTFVSGPNAFSPILDDYHRALYAAARSRQVEDAACPAFFSLYRCYNDMAWLLQHRSSFKTANAFSRCLRDHHEPPGPW